jgi:hypothetical protein
MKKISDSKDENIRKNSMKTILLIIKFKLDGINE